MFDLAAAMKPDIAGVMLKERMYEFSEVQLASVYEKSWDLFGYQVV